MSYSHVPVMLGEVLQYLQPRPGGIFLDATLGGAGYTLALADLVGSAGKIIAVDQDELAIDNARELIKKKKLSQIVLVQDNFKNLQEIVAKVSPQRQLDGIVFDLGLSTAQLDDESRGFSFQGERPLDMAFGPASQCSTVEIVDRYPLEELTRIFREYGEERQAYRIAKAIVAARRIKRITTTADLVDIITSVVPVRPYIRLHPATRVFQALRLETNDELGALAAALPAASTALKPGGRMVVVSFHSGEDRLVKRFFKSSDDLQILTKKPLIPAASEVEANPRARSAKFRAAAKL